MFSDPAFGHIFESSTIWQYRWFLQDLDQCPMLINADQNSGIDTNADQFRSMPINSDQFLLMPINANQCQIKQFLLMFYWCVDTGVDQHWSALIGIDRNWEVISDQWHDFDRHWSTLIGINQHWALIEGVLFLIIWRQVLPVALIFTFNSFWSWIRITELIKIWFSLGSSSPIYSVTGGTIPITCELFIAIQQWNANILILLL